MITIFTGSPGAGKTAAMVDLLDRELKGRPLFVHFDESERLRPEQKLLAETLQIPHTRCHASRWHEELPDGAVLVVDEAQGVWRASGPGSKVPPAIQALETHRHSGIDVFVTTQSSKLVHSSFRALVGRHVHIRDTGWMGRWWYEWPECNSESTWSRCQNKRRYRLPQRVFGLYRSSNEHTKVPRKVPPLVYGLAVAVFGIAAIGFNMWRTSGKQEAPPMPGSTMVAKPASQSASEAKTFIDDRVDFLPRVSNKPESAPAYDEVRKVVNMPLVSGGICYRGTCHCVTQQGTDAGLSDRECREWIARRPFDPYTVQQRPTSAVSHAGIASAGTRSNEAESDAAPSASATVVPMPSGVVNPRAEARTASPLPPGSPVHPTPAMDGQLPIAPPSLLSPYRRS
ncbi:zonular occludens toxin domain-containing protein [Acidovorax sp.]|uniref:zonular occludens toxin domain-containing protein n=1 Tax=Acidovorax sp. TaxID=1872122 RepID=UPI0039E25923